jgi:hypothetical protein
LPTTKEACTNCGALIVQQIAAAEQQAEVEQLLQQSPQRPIESPEEWKERTSPSNTASKSLRLPPPGGQDNSTFDPLSDTDKMRAIQVQPNNNPPPSGPAEGRELVQSRTSPYQVSQDMPGLQPYQSSQIASIDPRGIMAAPFGSQEVAVSSPMLTPLPRGFPKRPPDIVGTVIQVQSQVENQLMPDAADFIVKLLRDMIWSVPGDSQTMTPRQVYVTTLRIHTTDGAQEDARLEGYMRGVNLSLGDTVSLWGHKRKGLLRIYRGYNHTSKGVVKTHVSSAFLPGLVMVLLAVAVLYIFLLTYFHK